MTLSDIELMSYRRLGYADTPTTDVVTRIRQWINVWQQRILARPGMEQLRDVTATFSSVVNQTQYALPSQVRRVMKIFDPLTPVALRMRERVWLREIDPGLMATGIPEVWIPLTWNPASGGALSLQLWPTPTGVITYQVDAQGVVGPMSNATDVTQLPDEYGWLLVEAACYEEWLRKADTRAGTARQDLETGIKEMRHWLYSVRDYKPTNAIDPERPSRLGGMYPSWPYFNG